MMKIVKAPVPLIVPNPGDPRLTERVAGTDQTGASVEINVPVERPLTLYLNAQEIVTMMTIGDYPEYLALGYLLNQNMLKYDDVVTEVEYDDDLQVVVVRTEHHTNFEAKLKKRTQTSGCAQGTAFGDLMEAVENVALPQAELRTSWLYQMTHAINTMPSLYLEAGAIHGCVLVQGGHAGLLHRGRRPPQRRRQDRRLDLSPWRRSCRQDPLHYGTADFGNGDQDGSDGDSRSWCRVRASPPGVSIWRGRSA